MLKRRRGLTLVEILIALPLGVLLITAVLQVMFAAVGTYERNYFFSYDHDSRNTIHGYFSSDRWSLAG